MDSMKRREQYEAEQRARAAQRYLVRMSFERLGSGWCVKFTRPPSEWVLRVCTFADAEKIRSMYRRFGTRRATEDVTAFDYGILNGRGAVELSLGEEQNAALQNAKAPPRARL